MPNEKKLSPKHRLIKTPEVEAALAVVKSAQATYRATLEKLEPQLNIEAMKAAHRKFIEAAKTPEEIEVATRNYAALEGDAAIVGRDRARAMATQALHTFVATIPPLLTVAENAATEILSEAEFHEIALFSDYGLPHEETGIVRRVKGLLADLKQLRAGMVQGSAQSMAFRATAGAYANFVEFFK